MTVAELIEALKALPAGLRVGFSGDDGWFESEGIAVGTLRKYPGGAEWFEEGLHGESDLVVDLGA